MPSTERRSCCDSTEGEYHRFECPIYGKGLDLRLRETLDSPLRPAVAAEMVTRHPCCLTRAGGPHRRTCPIHGETQIRVEQTPECCSRPEGGHTDDCTSNEAVLRRVDLEAVRLDKMAQAVEYRMKHGNPLDRLKQMVEAGEMTAEREQLAGGTFIRFTSTKNPELKTRYGPLTEPMVQEAKWADATVTQALTPPQNQVTVTTKPGKYYPSKRVNWLRRRVGWVLIQLGYRVAGV